MGQPARPAPAAAELENFFAAEVGLKPPDVPKAMAIAKDECIDFPAEMSELARAGWVPSSAAGFTNMSFMGRHRLEQWVESARGGDASQAIARGGRGRGRGYPPQAARAAAPEPKRAGRAQREQRREHAPALADHPAAWAAAGDNEARVRFTNAWRTALILRKTVILLPLSYVPYL